MRQYLLAALLGGGALLEPCAGQAQGIQNPALNAPDELAWQLFIQVNAAAGGTNALFETWGSDTDLFQMNPQWPTTPKPMALRRPIVPTVGREALQRMRPSPARRAAGHRRRGRPRRRGATRRLRLHRKQQPLQGQRPAGGLRQGHLLPGRLDRGEGELAAGRRRSPAFTLNRVTAAQVPQHFHVNTGSDGNQYALVAMHVISKLVPNWTWATFEHQLNPGRCDIIGCRDPFGAQTAVVAPNAAAERRLSGLRQDRGALPDDRRRELGPGLRELLPQGLADRLHRQHRPLPCGSATR